MYFASNIKYLRGLKGWTQIELSEALALNPTTITGWEGGKSTPQFATLLQLREIFGVDLERLVFSDLRSDMPRTVKEDAGSYRAEPESNSRILELNQVVVSLQSEMWRLTALEKRVALMDQEYKLLLESLQSLRAEVQGKRRSEGGDE